MVATCAFQVSCQANGRPGQVFALPKRLFRCLSLPSASLFWSLQDRAPSQSQSARRQPSSRLEFAVPWKPIGHQARPYYDCQCHNSRLSGRLLPSMTLLPACKPDGPGKLGPAWYSSQPCWLAWALVSPGLSRQCLKCAWCLNTR